MSVIVSEWLFLLTYVITRITNFGRIMSHLGYSEWEMSGEDDQT